MPQPEWTPYQHAILDLMRQEGAAWESKLRGFSGADRADSEVHRLARLVYEAALEGDDDHVTREIQRLDAVWRAYAEAQARKVENAPKTKRGPYRGCSSIHWQWVSPELFLSRVNHLRYMIKAARERHR